jgi:hypothetical protein
MKYFEQSILICYDVMSSKNKVELVMCIGQECILECLVTGMHGSNHGKFEKQLELVMCYRFFVM